MKVFRSEKCLHILSLFANVVVPSQMLIHYRNQGNTPSTTLGLKSCSFYIQEPHNTFKNRSISFNALIQVGPLMVTKKAFSLALVKFQQIMRVIPGTRHFVSTSCPNSVRVSGRIVR